MLFWPLLVLPACTPLSKEPDAQARGPVVPDVEGGEARGMLILTRMVPFYQPILLAVDGDVSVRRHGRAPTRLPGFPDNFLTAPEADVPALGLLHAWVRERDGGEHKCRTRSDRAPASEPPPPPYQDGLLLVSWSPSGETLSVAIEGAGVHAPETLVRCGFAELNTLVSLLYGEVARNAVDDPERARFLVPLRPDRQRGRRQVLASEDVERWPTDTPYVLKADGRLEKGYYSYEDAQWHTVELPNGFEQAIGPWLRAREETPLRLPHRGWVEPPWEELLGED